jgi:hypothetical protein
LGKDSWSPDDPVDSMKTTFEDTINSSPELFGNKRRKQRSKLSEAEEPQKN